MQKNYTFSYVYTCTCIHTHVHQFENIDLQRCYLPVTCR